MSGKRLQTLASIATIFTVILTAGVYAEERIEASVYGFSSSIGSQRLLDQLSERGVDAVFHDLNKTENLEVFSKIVNLLHLSNVPVIPPEVCLNCYTSAGYTWRDVTLMFAAPLVGVFRDGRLTSMALAIVDSETMDRVVMENPQTGVKVFTNYGEYLLKDEAQIEELESLLKARKGDLAFTGLIAPIISLAAVDSINPCTFLVFTALLMLTLYSFGRGKTLLIGASFTLATLTGYYLLGLGLLRLMTLIPHNYLEYVVVALGLAAALDNILRGLRCEFHPRTPQPVRRLMSRFVIKAHTSPLASSVFGFIVSFTLLPCSGGPYMVGLGLLSSLKNQAQRYVLLLLYNLVFVAPLLVLLLGLTASAKVAEKVKRFRSPRRVRVIPLAGGILLATVCLYLLLT